MLFRGELRDRDVDEIGVAQVSRSIQERAAHRLDLEVDGWRGQQPLLLQVERFEDVQHLDESDPPRARRRHRDDLVTSIGAADWLSLFGLVRREIVLGNEAAVRFHVVGDAVGDPSCVKSLGSVVGDCAQRLREIAKYQAISRRPVTAARLRVSCNRHRKLGHASMQLTVQRAGKRLRQGESVFRQTDRRHDDLPPWKLAEPLVRQLQPSNGAGHAGRQITGSRQAAVDLAVGAEVHRASRFQRCFLPIVERGDLTRGRSDDHEAPSADVSGRGMGHRQSESGRDGCVDGISSGCERSGASVARRRRDAHDESVPGGHAEVFGRPDRTFGYDECNNHERDEWFHVDSSPGRPQPVPTVREL